VAFPGKLSVTPAQARRPPPRLGEHSREALADWLGLDAAALDALEATGAIAPR
jgi:crotonobetainyl-CoA:carnitine CoA-transferase CaiB-like acyl-CoA transferase